MPLIAEPMSLKREDFLPDIDWSGTPLGASLSWSAELQTAANIVLSSHFPWALVWGPEYTTLHNRAFLPILGDKPSAQGRSFADVWHEAWEEIGPIARRAYAGEATFVEDFPLEIERHGSAEQAYFTFCYSPVFGPDGTVLGIIDTVMETTARVTTERRNAALVGLGDRLRDATTFDEVVTAAAEFAGPALGASRAGYSRIDEARGSFTVRSDWTRAGVPSIAGEHDLASFGTTIDRLRNGQLLAVDDIASDPRLSAESTSYEAFGAVAQIRVPLLERGRLIGSFFVHDDRPRRWTAEEIHFVGALADRTYAAVAKLQAEAEQDVLNHELEHRLKNMMAMVQAIASQTLKGVTERDAVEAFERRIIAMAEAHDLLVRQNGSTTTMRAVVNAMLSLHGGDERFVVSGRDLPIGPKSAMSLALVLHELATNAAKYGALSVAEGSVHLRWECPTVDDELELVLTWNEVDGPLVHEPQRKGFGSRLIQMGIANPCHVEKRYEPAGIHVLFRARLASVQAS
ncbi:MAG: GAF domain-containing protein [Novosphingobium sp.]|nr:GAF domain-containing protein [Novosphingobium sp.]